MQSPADSSCWTYRSWQAPTKPRRRKPPLQPAIERSPSTFWIVHVADTNGSYGRWRAQQSRHRRKIVTPRPTLGHKAVIGSSPPVTMPWRREVPTQDMPGHSSAPGRLQGRMKETSLLYNNMATSPTAQDIYAYATHSPWWPYARSADAIFATLQKWTAAADKANVSTRMRSQHAALLQLLVAEPTQPRRTLRMACASHGTTVGTRTVHRRVEWRLSVQSPRNVRVRAHVTFFATPDRH